MLCWAVGAAMLYVVVGIVLAFIGLLLLLVPGHPQQKRLAWTISMVILSASQGIAMWGLSTLAINVHEEIKFLRPYGKFMSVKFVVFFAFWQGLMLNGLKAAGAFDFFDHGCGADCAVTVFQNLMICMEMLVASIVQFYVFPGHDYLKLLAQHRVKHDIDGEKALVSPPSVTEVVDVRDMFLTAWQVHFACGDATVDANDDDTTVGPPSPVFSDPSTSSKVEEQCSNA